MVIVATSLAVCLVLGGSASAAMHQVHASGRCRITKSTSPLSLVCGTMLRLDYSRQIWNTGVARLAPIYGKNMSLVSAEGRSKWQALARNAAKPLLVSEAICSPRRKPLRSRLAAGDRLVLQRLCVALVDTMAIYHADFVLATQRRGPNASERRVLRSIFLELRRNKPRLKAALGAVQPL
jgi:hypothetical protein